MFEVGFSELCMVALVALLVIGPEKLPKIARLAGFWAGKTRTIITNVKAEINEELKAEEMRQLFKEQQASLSQFQVDLDRTAENMQSSLIQAEQPKEQQEKHTPHDKTT